jgi:hypothetical protein
MGNELSSVLLRLDVIEMKPAEERKAKPEAGSRQAPRKET